MLRLWIRKYGLSGNMIMAEMKRIYTESGFLNSVHKLSFGVLPPGLPELLYRN